MAGAAYECIASCTDDETFVLTCQALKADGSVFETDEYTWDYVLKGCGVNLLLTQDNGGVTVDDVTATITITPGVDYRLAAGNYTHGFRKTHIESGQVDQIFDGTVTVTEGHFS